MSVRRESAPRSPERGQVIVFFALLLPVLLAISGIVVGAGNWFVHGRHLQTKADAGALAGGNTWSFPCSADTDTTIISEARRYSGSENPQVGNVPDASIHSKLNAPTYYDDDSNNILPGDEFTDPNGPVCEAKILDVKVTEDNSFPLASVLPVFPDIKRKARVEIQEASDLSGLLPIAVRVPKPLSAAAVYIDQRPATFGQILATRYFNDICEPPGYTDCRAAPNDIPSGLDQWTTEGGGPASIASMPPRAGVVIALSFRPRCTSPGNPARCFDIDPTSFPGGGGMTAVEQLCNQGTGAGIVQCHYTTQSGGNQLVHSGLQFIRSWSPAPTPGDPEPDLHEVWIDASSPSTNCSPQGYFNSPGGSNACTVLLHANIDPGFGGAGQYEIRYKLVSGNTSWQEDDAPGPCNDDFGANCVLGAGGTTSLQLDPQYARHAVALSIWRYNIPDAVRATYGLPNACGNNNPTVQCSWYFPDLPGNLRGTASPSGNNGAARIFANPVQQAFMGNLDRSGPVKFLHLYEVNCADETVVSAGWGLTATAASVQAGGAKCFKVDIGLQGALAREQDEYPIQLNVGSTSQSSVVDCDDSLPNLKDEIVFGCGGDDQFPTYKKHDFAQVGANGRYCPDWNGINDFFNLPKPSPWDGWAPFTCVATQTAASPNQVVQGFHERFFGVPNNPTCPPDVTPGAPGFQWGRNYWHDLNNTYFYDPPGTGPGEGNQEDYFSFTDTSRQHGNHLRTDDPRFVLLFITPYNSFTGNGNEIYPITLVGGFYITGYGRILGNGNLVNEDPCSDGAPPGALTSPYAGNSPPPDLDTSTSGAVAWGHFVVPVDLGASSPNGQLCQPATPTVCVSVLVE